MTTTRQDEYTVDDLPRFSPWPERLLGLAEWQQRKKTPAQVTREFDRDKWGSLLERYRATGGTSTLDDVEGWMLESTAPCLCSIGQRFELLSARQALDRHYEIIAETLARLLPASALVELGAGYGSVILRIATDSRFRGIPLYAGEYTSSGVNLLAQLARSGNVDLRVGHCDLTMKPLTDLPIPNGSVLFTCMAAHYIPQIEERFVAAVCDLQPKVVAQFEPCYEHCDRQTLIGALRRRYIELNDYNRNLASLLRESAATGTICLHQEVPAVIGVNPLLPISILVWQPVRG